MKIDCKITAESSAAIKEYLKCLNSLKEINLKSKIEDKVANKIGDEGLKAIFICAMYLTNLQRLNLNGNKE